VHLYTRAADHERHSFQLLPQVFEFLENLQSVVQRLYFHSGLFCLQFTGDLEALTYFLLCLLLYSVLFVFCEPSFVSLHMKFHSKVRLQPDCLFNYTIVLFHYDITFHELSNHESCFCKNLSLLFYDSAN